MVTDAASQMGENLRALRRNAQLTQEQLGAEMSDRGFKSWNKTVVSRSETGKRRLTLDESMALSDILGWGLFDDVPERAREAMRHSSIAAKVLQQFGSDPSVTETVDLDGDEGDDLSSIIADLRGVLERLEALSRARTE